MKNKNNKQNKPDKLNSIFCVHGEMVPNNGEDCYYFGANSSSAIISVFDGCGGIGSKRYNNFSGKTGAYIASRAVAGAVKAWFDENGKAGNIKEYIQWSLRICNKFADSTGRIMGSLGKSFPTTAAIIHTQSDSATCYWAGDSRCFMLNSLGLHQLSTDDIDGEDAFSNITSDGVLTNVICSSSDFTVHEKKFNFKYPCIFITSSDGCFGYLPSPMDFEFLLTKAIISCDNSKALKEYLNNCIKEYTGDDYTLCISVFGFDSYTHMKEYFIDRCTYVKNTFIDSDMPLEDKWNIYKGEYSKYLS
ncbi:MAG: hypothetical protein E7600_03055 [Ruminococcaceae bacterium]|nr:hypothetical protein [Oscillospiraceae bacterium]